MIKLKRLRHEVFEELENEINKWINFDYQPLWETYREEEYVKDSKYIRDHIIIMISK